MKYRLKTTRVLIIDSLLIVLLAVAFVLTNIYLARHVNSNLKAIDRNMDTKLSLVLDMNNIARERSAVMLRMYRESDDWKIDEQYVAFHRLALTFIELRAKLINTDLSADEKQLLDHVLQIVRLTEPLQNEIVEKIKSGDAENVGHDISQKDLPLEIELLGIFERLSKKIIQTSSESRQEIQNQFQTTLLAVSLASILIVLGLALLMTHSLKKIQKIETDLLLEADSLSWDATHDSLTNIYNRRWLQHKINHLFDNEDPISKIHTLIYIDLDGFKSINDRYGHVAGDTYLQSVCRVIETCIRQNDFFARIGGDEFAVLLEKCELFQARAIAENILKTVNNFVCNYENNTLSASCSIGVHEFDKNHAGFEDIIKEADALCYQSKKSGKNRITFHKIA